MNGLQDSTFPRILALTRDSVLHRVKKKKKGPLCNSNQGYLAIQGFPLRSDQRFIRGNAPFHWIAFGGKIRPLDIGFIRLLDGT